MAWPLRPLSGDMAQPDVRNGSQAVPPAPRRDHQWQLMNLVYALA
jgi:hypothetical protein